MQELKLYSVNDGYVQYLRKEVTGRVISNLGDNYSVSRKYLGIVLKIDNYNYYVPLSSPKQADYEEVNGQMIIRKSIIPIMRIIDTGSDGKEILLGTLRFSHMIPVPQSEILLYDVNAEKDIKYKSLIQKELRFVRRNTSKILKSASIIYKQKNSNLKINYLNSTLDFRLLENAHDDYRVKN